MQFNTDTSSWGPGLWFAIHLHAHVADSTDNRKAFVDFVKKGVSEHLPCLKCRTHCKEYIQKQDPIDNLLSKSPTVSCLVWSWKFHNAVNERTGSKYKPSIQDLSTYLQTLREGGGCEDCSIKAPTLPPPPSTASTTSMHTIKLRRQYID